MRGKKRIIIEAAAGIVVLAVALLVGLNHFRAVQSTWTIRGPEGETIFGFHNDRNDGFIAYASDGNMLAVPTAAGIFVWDINWSRYRPRYFLQEYLEDFPGAKQIRNIAISRDGSYVLDGQHDGTVRVYDVLQEKLLYKLNCPAGLDSGSWRGYPNSEVMCLAFSPDGKQAAVGHRGGLVRVLNVETGEERCSFDYDELYNPRTKETPALLKFSFDGDFLLIAHAQQDKEQIDAYHGDHCLVDLNHPSQLHIFTQVKSYIQNLAFMPDGKTYCTLTTDKVYLDTEGSAHKLQAWDIQTGQERTDLSLPQPKGVIELTINKNGDFLGIYEDYGNISIRNESDQKDIWQHSAEEVKRNYWAAHFSPNGDYVISSAGPIPNGERFYAHRDPETGKVIRNLNADLNLPDSFIIREFSADGRLAAGFNLQRNTLICIDFKNKKYCTGQTSLRSYSIKFSGNGNRLLLPDYEKGYAEIFETSSAAKIADFGGLEQKQFSNIQLSYDGSQVLIPQAGGAYLVDIETGNTVQTFMLPSEIPTIHALTHETTPWDSKDFYCNEAVFHPDGKHLISNVFYKWKGSNDIHKYYYPLQVWNIQTGELIKTIEMNQGASFIALSPDGHWLTASTNDGKFHLIDLESGRRYAKDIIGYSDVKFSPNGSRVLITTGHGVQQIWDFEHLLSTCREYTE